LLGFSILYISKKTVVCDVKREMQQSQLPYMRIGDSAFLKLTDVFGIQLQCGKKSFDIMLGASVDERKKNEQAESQAQRELSLLLEVDVDTEKLFGAQSSEFDEDRRKFRVLGGRRYRRYTALRI